MFGRVTVKVGRRKVRRKIMGPQRKSSPSVFIFVFTFFKVRLHKHELVYPKLKRR